MTHPFQLPPPVGRQARQHRLQPPQGQATPASATGIEAGGGTLAGAARVPAGVELTAGPPAAGLEGGSPRPTTTRPLLSPFSLLLAVSLALPVTTRAQSPDLARERADYATWLATAPLSPYATVALQPIGPGLTLGPADSDLPLEGFGRGAVHEFRGSVWLERDGRRTALPRERPVLIGGYRLLASGPSGRTVLAVYGPVRGAHPPEWYPPAPRLRATLPLEPPERRDPFRTLGPDGLETDAREAGFVTFPLPDGGTARLRVYQVGSPDDMDSALLLYFRDATNGKGSYPAGRFVTLQPAGGDHFVVDLNRARNPFCAYSSVYPCPPPWPGNTIGTAIAAGEQYRQKP